MSPRLPIIDYSRHPAYGGMFEPDDDLRGRALSVLTPLVDQQLQVDALKRETFGYRYGGEGAHGRELAETGLLRFQLTQPMIDPIGQASAPVVAEVRTRLDRMRAAGETVHFPHRSQPIDPVAYAELWRALHAALSRIDAFGLTTRFFGTQASKLQSAQILLSPPDLTENPAAENAGPPTEGLHIDSSGRCILKGVLYLDDVGPGQGPFGMIPGSHRWEEGSLGRVYRRAFDRSALVSRGVKQRRLFMSLPTEMQVKAEFGSDLLPESAEGRELIDQEAVSLGPRGLLSLFDPEAIHRGGQARDAERQAILVTLVARW